MVMCFYEKLKTQQKLFKYTSFSNFKMVYQKNPKIIDKETEAGLLLFNTDSGKMVELNITAKILWQKTKDSFTLEDLKKIIEENCNSADDIDKDLSEFIEITLKYELVNKDGKD